MTSNISDLVAQRLDVKDDQLLRMGDALDVKASIELIVITFLATQTADFLNNAQIVGLWAWLQLGSAVALIVAGVFALWELWPRDYEVEASESLEGWASELCDFYKREADAELKIAESLHMGRIKRVKERVAANNRVNDWKSRLLMWSFRFTGAAMIMNLLTLIGQAFR